MRLGTALINQSWIVRQLKRHAHRIVAMHDHRHVDWTGRCGPVRIISAPSPVMNEAGYFLIRTLQIQGGSLALCLPWRINAAHT